MNGNPYFTIFSANKPKMVDIDLSWLSYHDCERDGVIFSTVSKSIVMQKGVPSHPDAYISFLWIRFRRIRWRNLSEDVEDLLGLDVIISLFFTRAGQPLLPEREQDESA